MAAPRTHFSIPLSDHAHAWILRQAALAGEMPGPWFEAWLLSRLRAVALSTEAREIVQNFSVG